MSYESFELSSLICCAIRCAIELWIYELRLIVLGIVFIRILLSVSSAVYKNLDLISSERKRSLSKVQKSEGIYKMARGGYVCYMLLLFDFMFLSKKKKIEIARLSHLESHAHAHNTISHINRIIFTAYVHFIVQYLRQRSFSSSLVNKIVLFTITHKGKRRYLHNFNLWNKYIWNAIIVSKINI